MWNKRLESQIILNLWEQVKPKDPG